MKNDSIFHTKLLRYVTLAIMTALVIVLQTVASGIKIGSVPITLTLVPIVIVSVLYGPVEGGFLGAVFGAITLIAGISGADAFTFTLFTATPVATVITCLGKAILAGVVPGLLYRLFKNKTLGCIVASVAAPIVNTGIFALCALTILKNGMLEMTAGSELVYFVFVGCIGVNFIVEFVINALLSTAVSRIVLAVDKSNGAKNYI